MSHIRPNHAFFAKPDPDYDEPIELLAEQVVPSLC